jgi:hypothetical protein
MYCSKNQWTKYYFKQSTFYRTWSIWIVISMGVAIEHTLELETFTLVLSEIWTRPAYTRRRMQTRILDLLVLAPLWNKEYHKKNGSRELPAQGLIPDASSTATTHFQIVFFHFTEQQQEDLPCVKVLGRAYPRDTSGLPLVKHFHAAFIVFSNDDLYLLPQSG